MSPTNAQIIEEAERRWLEEYKANGGRPSPHSSKEIHVINIMRENWTPPEPVDPDILAFREWAAKDWVEHYPAEVDDVQRGKRDGCDIAKAYLAGARMATERERERERERAKVLVEFAKLMADKSIFPEVSLRALAALAKYQGEAR